MRKIYSIMVVLTIIAGSIAFGFKAFDDHQSTQRISENKLSYKNQSIILNVTPSTSTNEKLVPEGYAIFKGQTEVVTLTYSIDVSELKNQNITLTAEALNIQIGDSDLYSNLVSITIVENHIEIDEDLEKITVEVRLIEPEDEEAFHAISGKNITFQLRIVARQ